MPGFDGTGPRGKGAMTGCGIGYCVVKVSTDNIKVNDKGKGVFDMPRGDGTGPMGQGPMTGRGAGFCAGYNTPGYMNPVFGRGYAGMGRGFFGRGGGRGWRRYPYTPEMTPKQELDILKNEADILKRQLEDIQGRIEILEKE